MRSIGPAGWGSHGYYGATAKTFGNPSGASSGSGAVVPPPGGPVKAFANALATRRGSTTIVLGGFETVTSEVFTAVRANSSFLATAAQPDNVIAALSNGIGGIATVPGGFIAIDSNGLMAFANQLAAAWAAVTTAGGAVNGTQAVAGDDVHHTVVYADIAGDGWVSPDSGTPDFATQSTVDAGEIFPPLAYKGPGTGILLGVSGGTTIIQSTDGGATWVTVGSPGFAGGTLTFLGFGSTQWLATGDDGSVNQFSVSTDDGVTWSAPAPFPGAGNTATGFVSAATDNSNTWVVGNLQGSSPDNYWVSNDDGSNWTSPNAFANSGWQAIAVTGGTFCAVLRDPTVEFTTLATSVNANNWVTGATVTEPS